MPASLFLVLGYHCNGGVDCGWVSVLSSTFFAPLSVALAPLWTAFFVPCLILWPVFFAALAVEWAASFVSCLIPLSLFWARAPRESARDITIANRTLNCI